MFKLSEKTAYKRNLNQLVTQAVNQQVEKGDAEATYLRNRRRYLAKQVTKGISPSSMRSPRKALHAATMLLGLWGFVGINLLPQCVEAGTPVFVQGSGPFDSFDIGIDAKPSFADIDNDGDLDAFIGGRITRPNFIKFYQNDGAGMFVPADGINIINPLASVGYHNLRSVSPSFADIDNDGDLDAFIGDGYSYIHFHQNNGSGQFTHAFESNPLSYISTYACPPWRNYYCDSGNPSPSFGDIDNDGDLDVFVGTHNYYWYLNPPSVRFYTNEGSSGFWSAPSLNPLSGISLDFATPSLVDIDGDGDLDAFIGSNNGKVNFYQNNGAGVFTPADGINIINPLAGIDVGWSSAPTFADIDKDGDLDAFIGSSDGTVRTYTNLEFTSGSAAIPDIKANGQDTPLTITQGSPLTITTSLISANLTGRNADWWIYADAANGKKYWYQPSGQWVASISPLITHSGPLVDRPSKIILTKSSLPIGSYIVHFAVDNNMDGIMDQTYKDQVHVQIQ